MPPPPRREDSPARLFLERYPLDPRVGRREQLACLTRSFSRLPYENLTKIIAHEKFSSVRAAQGDTARLILDHLRHGTGGTCFALTIALHGILEELGFRAEPILADRPYGPNTHCALLVWLDGRTHLIDPGFLINDPVPLDGPRPISIDAGFQQTVLKPVSDDRMELHSRRGGREQLRITFRTVPADPSSFLRAWDDSFGWDMMRYPIVTSLWRDSHVYLRANRLQTRSPEGLSREEVDPSTLPELIRSVFGVHPVITREALAILQRRGERLGGP